MNYVSSSWTDWSCTVRLTMVEPAPLASAVLVLRSMMAEIDEAASRFRPDSALTWANDHAGRPVAVNRILIDLVDVALNSARRTDGAVDPSLGRAIIDAGYDRDIAEVTGTRRRGPRTPVRCAAKNWRQVRLNRELGLLTVPAGSALDLGATAKAYTADLAARRIADRFGTAVLVEIGGDIAVAGELPGGWPIAVAEREGAPGQVVRLSAGGLTTSTTTVRRWHLDDHEAHHIIDPSTGLPADGPWRTVSVAADSALNANTASTAAIVMGDAAVGWLQGSGHDARLVDRDGVVHYVGAWPVLETQPSAA